MPGMYHGDYDLAGFAVGAAERGTLLPTARHRAGDVLLGLASSGVHSNGFSLVRRIVERSASTGTIPRLSPRYARALARPLLEPTRIYVKPLLQAIRGHIGIKALAHITGGGFPTTSRASCPRIFRPSSTSTPSSVPPVFSWLAKTGGVAPEEMMRTFNCGIGMVIVVASGQAAQVAAVLQEAGETVTPIGRIVPRREPASSTGAIWRCERRAQKARRILISGRGSNMATLIEAAAGPPTIRRRSSAVSFPTMADAQGPGARRRRKASPRPFVERSKFSSKEAHDEAIDAALEGSRRRDRLPRRLYAAAHYTSSWKSGAGG
jgi:hypothetical protein